MGNSKSKKSKKTSSNSGKEEVKKNVSWHKIEIDTSFTQRFDHTIISTKNDIFLYGGMKEGWEIQSDLWKFDGKKWTLISFDSKEPEEFPKPAKDHTAIYNPNNNKMYIFGGKTHGKHTLNDLYILDIEKMRWKQVEAKEDVPTKTYGHSAVLFNNKMYIFGGKRHTKDETMLDELWEFDTEKCSWNKIETKSGPEGMQYQSAVVYNGHMWLVGGYRKKEPLREFWSLNLENFEWKRQPDVPFAPRSGHAATVLGDAMFIFSGEGKNEKGVTCEPDSWKFDFKRNEWEQLSMEGGPAPRLGARADVLNGAIILTGGIKVDPSWNPEAWFNDSWTCK